MNELFKFEIPKYSITTEREKKQANWELRKLHSFFFATHTHTKSVAKKQGKTNLSN